MAQVVFEGGATVVEVDPEYDSLDEQMIGAFCELLLRAVATAEPPALVIDLSRTRFIGSSFLGVLMRAWKRLRDRDGRMAICCVPSNCAEVLRVSKLDSVWNIYPTRDEAVREVVQASCK
ncbi:MAG TPA: STAS domain-containing protein [Pirellulales bacterium]|nr:STAS domain-containing protein [Pirellulales bacterium]